MNKCNDKFCPNCNHHVYSDGKKYFCAECNEQLDFMDIVFLSEFYCPLCGARAISMKDGEPDYDCGCDL